MMVKNLYELVLGAKNGDKDSMMEIITIFMPLIKKYSRKLLYDGAETDLIILVIKLIKAYPISKNKFLIHDKDIIAYIHVSIKHEYIRLSKKFSKISVMEMELNEEVCLIQEKDNIENILIINE